MQVWRMARDRATAGAGSLEARTSCSTTLSRVFEMICDSAESAHGESIVNSRLKIKLIAASLVRLLPSVVRLGIPWHSIILMLWSCISLKRREGIIHLLKPLPGNDFKRKNDIRFQGRVKLGISHE